MPNEHAGSRRGLPLRHIAKAGLVAAVLGAPGAACAEAEMPDLAAMPIEKLLTLEVYSASKFVQPVSDAPSAVSIVTAADIKAFGWRTLADILRSMRGLYVAGDRNYGYLGARGFLRPGDYNTRFLLLVDGKRGNDVVYDQASISSEFVLDVDLIERVEYVPGPGSAIYGANAFFGVINVITKSGRDLGGPQVAVEAGSHGARKARASIGVRGEHGGEFLLSASAYRVAGQDLYFPEFDAPGVGDGVARGLDHDRGESAFMKASAGPFSLSLAHSTRRKGIPTAAFSQVFSDPRSHTVDFQSFADLGYHAALDGSTELSSRVYWGRFDSRGDYIYEPAALVVNRDRAQARSWGGEAKLVTTRHAGHKLVLGAEYRRDYRRDQFNTDVDPYVAYLADRRSGSRAGIYVADEMALREDLLLNAGVRYDHNGSPHASAVNPRLALIYKASGATTLKALYGTAFRAPNAYELYYDVPGPGGQQANPALSPERIRSAEFIAEHHFSSEARLTASLFHNTVSNLISQTQGDTGDQMVFRNLDRAIARGLELEFERAWRGGARLRTSYSWQRAHDAGRGALLVNSPRHLAKLSLSVPLLRAAWRAGAEAQYVGPRKTLAGEAGGYWLANLTLASLRLAPGLEAFASVYNLLDRRYADPGSVEHAPLDAIPQAGRELRFKLVYSF